MTTLRTIKDLFPEAIGYEQIKRKQLFIITYSDYRLLVSYRTIVGVAVHSEPWQLTTEKYGSTTSSQLGQVYRSESAVWVGPERLASQLALFR